MWKANLRSRVSWLWPLNHHKHCQPARALFFHIVVQGVMRDVAM